MNYRLDVHTGYYRLNLQWTTNIISNILFWCILPGTNKKLYSTLQYDQLMDMMVISIIDHSTYPWQHKVASNSKAPMFHYIEAICFTEKRLSSMTFFSSLFSQKTVGSWSWHQMCIIKDISPLQNFELRYSELKQTATLLLMTSCTHHAGRKCLKIFSINSSHLFYIHNITGIKLLPNSLNTRFPKYLIFYCLVGQSKQFSEGFCLITLHNC